jgi:hypothetical protein
MYLTLPDGTITEFDDADLELLSGYAWFGIKKKSGIYVAAKVKVDGKLVTMYMHRLILNAKKGDEIRHVDNRGENNHRVNLVIGKRSDTICNRGKRKGGSSQYIGVSKGKIGWIAQIQRGGKITRIGVYSTEIEAALAYNEAALEKHGKYARLNVVE